MIKVFISHKKEDSAYALLVKRAFDDLSVESYLDLLDDSVNSGGKALTDHIKSNLNDCTDIIVVMSEATKRSWWVPFEIGMAAQVNMPIASYLTSSVSLPEYLDYWPRLKSISDIAKYVHVRKRVALNYISRDPHTYTRGGYRHIETPAFYNQLKYELR